MRTAARRLTLGTALAGATLVGAGMPAAAQEGGFGGLMATIDELAGQYGEFSGNDVDSSDTTGNDTVLDLG